VTRKIAFSLFAGVLFGAGLALSGMTQPSKVIGFLDFTGAWDPSLALVMVGAIAVHLTGLRLFARQRAPWFAPAFEPVADSGADRRVLLGSALFGIGWGIAGYCPGPALVSLAAGTFSALVFGGALLCGVGLYEIWLVPRAARRAEPTCGGADIA
jgi:uncharacterized membrane protein YedE/YeeE